MRKLTILFMLLLAISAKAQITSRTANRIQPAVSYPAGIIGSVFTDSSTGTPYVCVNTTCTTGGTGWQSFLTSGAAVSATSFSATGTGGAGFVSLAEQSGTPTTPTNAVRLYADGSNVFKWVDEGGTVHTVADLAGSQTFTNKTLTAPIITPSTVAGLPSAASSTGKTYRVTDASVAGSCTSGGGTSVSLCVSNGSAWVGLGDGGGVAGSGSVNSVPKFTPNGTTLGNSTYTDTGTIQSIGSLSSAAVIELDGGVPSTVTIGDKEGNGNATKLIINDVAKSISLSTDGGTVTNTVGSGSMSVTTTEAAPRLDIPAAARGGAGTNALSAGDYSWKVTYLTAEGETEASDASNTLTIDPLTQDPPTVTLPIGSHYVLSRKLYRTTAGGSTYKLVATISDNTTATYDDDIADASLGVVAPTVNTTANPVLSVNGAAGTLGRISDDGTDITATTNGGIDLAATDPSNGANNSHVTISQGNVDGITLQSKIVSINGNVLLDKTITPAGTTGNQTINDVTIFTVNFAAAATSLTVTSNRIATTSILQCTVRTNDATLRSVQAVAGAGSVVLYGNAAASAETSVGCSIGN